MREHLRHAYDEATAGQWIEDFGLVIATEDHESLWRILGAALGFDFTPDERMEFIRRCLRSLLDAGAVPVEFTGEDSPMFVPTDRFGTRRDEIVEAVIADWQARGGGKLEWGEYPFTLPENFDPFGPKG